MEVPPGNAPDSNDADDEYAFDGHEKSSTPSILEYLDTQSGGGSVVSSNETTKINTDDSGIGKFSARSSSETTGSRSATTADSDDSDEETDTSESQETSEERAI